MEHGKLENYLKKLMHTLAEINQEIFLSGDYKDFLALCNNDISIINSLVKCLTYCKCSTNVSYYCLL